MLKSNGQCASIHIPARNSRHPLLCAECHKQFRTVQELCLHSEMCIIESFENEAVSVFSSMPSLTEATAVVATATHSGITAKGDDPPILVPETGASTSLLNSRNLSLSAKCKGKFIRTEKSVRPAMERSKTETIPFTSTTESEQRCWPSTERSQKVAVELGNARILESRSGLKIYISVEKQSPRGIDGTTSENDDRDSQGTYSFDELSPKRKVIGALANANDDDICRPKMECPTCGLVLYRHNFGTHYRIHTGELPFVCTYCQRRFRTTSALKVHIRAHTGEKPYLCPKCPYSCITKRNLDRHIVNNHIREGERRGPRERRSRYRRDEYNVIIDDIDNGTVKEGGKIDHHYVIAQPEIENSDMVKEKAHNEVEGGDDSHPADMAILPLLTS